MPATTLIASIASMHPISPGTGPSTPASPQLRTTPGGRTYRQR